MCTEPTKHIWQTSMEIWADTMMTYADTTCADILTLLYDTRDPFHWSRRTFLEIYDTDFTMSKVDVHHHVYSPIFTQGLKLCTSAFMALMADKHRKRSVRLVATHQAGTCQLGPWRAIAHFARASAYILPSSATPHLGLKSSQVQARPPHWPES